jgi:hypothetical protein
MREPRGLLLFHELVRRGYCCDCGSVDEDMGGVLKCEDCEACDSGKLEPPWKK